MRPYPRPFLKSSRVRHFAAGLGAAFVLLALSAAADVGIAPMNRSEGIMDLSVDVRDVPCNEPFDENDRVQVIPDTLSGRIGVQVVVRNRQCCCCEGEGYGPLGELRQGGAATPVKPTTAPPVVTPSPEPEVKSFAAVEPEAVRPLAPLATRPGAPAFGAPANVSAPVAAAATPRLPWWLALAAAPAVVLFGSDSNDVCEDDETGGNSGPARACDADADFRRAQERQLTRNAS